ncbi:D-arabinono-1,4-lactone oxidase-domain-containing protein [Mycena leptocephala]|nr:D-arabinono-1,4-lactone oxidase-domain-containing protein [Mycena leptocephala]
MATTATAALQRQGADDILAAITVPSTSARAKFINWGLSYHCHPLAIFEPENEHHCEVVLEFARKEGRVLRAVGVGHSPSDLACTGDFMLKMTKLNKLLEVCRSDILPGHGVTLVSAGEPGKALRGRSGGITLTDLHVELGKLGLAMRNLGSISDQTLGGIVATSSHGSGIAYPVMSADVAALTLLLADGSRRADLFIATLCGLGATGIILTVQLEVERAFRLKDVQCSRTFEDVVSHLDEFVRSAQHVRFWWIAATHTVKCSVVNRTQEPKRPPIPWFWRSLLAFHVVQFFLFVGRYFAYVNTLTGRFVAWLSSGQVTLVDDSHTIFNVECRYPQHTTEWAIPFKNAPACLRELHDWMDAEAADPNGNVLDRYCAVQTLRLQRTLQTLLRGLRGDRRAPRRRPHWAKAHHFAPETLRTLYPRFDDFVRVMHEVDPEGVFRNEYVRRHVLGEAVGERVFKLRRE